MAQTGFNTGFDVNIRNNANGINYDCSLQDDYYCSEFCDRIHTHNYRPDHISHTFRKKDANQQQSKSPEIPAAHICDNNCNHMYPLSQIQRNRIGKQSGKLHIGASENIGFGNKKFTYNPSEREKLSPRLRNRRRKRNRMVQEPEKMKVAKDYKITIDDKMEFPNKSAQEIGEIRNNQRMQMKIRKNLINKQRQLEKVINDNNESLIVQKNQIEKYNRNQEYQSKTEESKVEESETNRKQREINLGRVMHFGNQQQRKARPNRARINERYNNELSQKREKSIFEKDVEDDEKQEIEVTKTSMQEELIQKRHEEFKKRETEKWNQFVWELNLLQETCDKAKIVMNSCKMTKQLHNGIQAKLDRKEEISDVERNQVLSLQQLNKLEADFKQAESEYNDICKELELFENDMIDLKQVTKPSLKHLQAMNKIDKRISNISSNLDDIPVNMDSLMWDDAMGGWFHKGMPQYQTKMEILKLARINRIKPRERNQIIVRNIDKQIKSMADFNHLLDELIDDMIDFANKNKINSVWNELSNKDIVDFKSYIIDSQVYNEWNEYKVEMEKQNENGLENENMDEYYNETGLILRILLNDDGPFFNKYRLHWKQQLRDEFEQYYLQSDKILGKNAVLDFNDVQKTYQFWMYMPKQRFPNRPGIINELKDFVVKSITNNCIEKNDIVAVSRSNPKFPERVYYTIKGEMPREMPEYFGSKRYFYTVPVTDRKILSEAQQCMSFIPQCDACLLFGHRQGMGCPHIRRTLTQARKRIESNRMLSREEMMQQKKDVKVHCVGCHYCSDKWHIAKDCRNEAYCINCKKQHPAIKDFSCEKLQEMGLLIYQFEDMYKLARSQHMKPPRKPEIGEKIQWSQPWKETHDLIEALKLEEFKKIAPIILQKREVVINYKRNIAKLGKLKMKILFMEHENEVDNIYTLMNEIDLLDAATEGEIDKIIKMDKILKGGKNDISESDSEEENGNQVNNSEDDSNDDDILMGNNNNNNKEENEKDLPTPTYASNDELQQQQQSQSQTQATQNSVVSGANVIPFGEQGSSRSESKPKSKKSKSKNKKHKKKNKRASDKVSEKATNKNNNKGGILRAEINKFGKFKNGNESKQRQFIGAAIESHGIAGAKIPQNDNDNVNVRNEKQMEKIIHDNYEKVVNEVIDKEDIVLDNIEL